MDAKGNLFFTDGSAIRYIDIKASKIHTLAGSLQTGYADGTNGCKTLFGPILNGIVVSRLDPYLLVTDPTNHVVRSLDYLKHQPTFEPSQPPSTVTRYPRPSYDALIEERSQYINA